MSRQYDESLQNKFEYCGEMYSLVDEITSLADLTEALKILDMLNACERQYEPDSGHPCFWMLRRQEEVIKEYMESVGEFDNSIFLSNLNYLLRANNIRIGELEQMLGISSGYISRTAKQGSAKKMSIDVVWKIAALFKVDIQDLLEKEISYTETNIEIISRFLAKVGFQTESHIVEWENAGGCTSFMEKPFGEIDLFTEQEDGPTIYHPDDHLNTEIKWVLKDDLYYTTDVVPGKKLVIVHFGSNEKESMEGYDFILLYGENNEMKWTKAFYSCDDRFGTLNSASEKMMAQVLDQEFDAILPHEVRTFITEYLKEEN